MCNDLQERLERSGDAVSTIQDVAKLAGVSTTLVSRTINHQYGVSEKSRQRILAAMEQLNYQPNALARSLVLKSTGTIGIVMDNLCESYFFDLINGLEEGADKAGVDIVFSSGRSSVSVKERYVKYFMQGRTDGIVFYGSFLSDEELIQSLSSSAFPFVVVENTFPALDINNVVLDNAFGSSMAVDHLIQCGCRRIFHVGGDMNQRVSIDRRNGYIQAMQRHGVVVNDRMIIQADFDVKNSYQTMKAYLASVNAEDVPDAFYCGSDNTAFGVVMALEEAGFSVPDRVKIVGFDGETPPYGYHYKALTTLTQPLHQMGEAAVEILCKAIEQPDAPKQRVIFYPELLVQETTK